MFELDDIDLKILALKQDNACMSNADLAKSLGMAPSAMLERVRKLEKRGIIQSYTTRINPLALNQRLLAFVFIKTSSAPCDCNQDEAIVQLPGIQEVHHIAGDDCYLIKIRTENSQSLVKWMREELGRVSGILSTRTTIVLETLKETTQLTIPNLQNENDRQQL
ncbi:Lrp/AsnC family transcriptional regulator [Solitalea canadensis]|uniref:Transcriptional regulator n=1 Tax=Solitalea canadensis (strain ATCC 29591 / DSM 3403 / JCM 21819 / LMG 8368 / NBRC 15130 / NCIMB 12057 / USAM 9D) TaxID=929556 RepID=H8KUS4_SOLCM|nr:Lrp/AsnC family transcriptional regulator [Solitalea canadensis]AFD07558.1 transcriptional regulator [Solitalea canadensis DSM 3403]